MSLHPARSCSLKSVEGHISASTKGALNRSHKPSRSLQIDVVRFNHQPDLYRSYLAGKYNSVVLQSLKLRIEAVDRLIAPDRHLPSRKDRLIRQWWLKSAGDGLSYRIIDT